MSYSGSINSLSESLTVNKGNILVTGATGLIGTCLIDCLIAANKNGADFKIYALSRSEQRIKDKFGNAVIPVVQDISEPLNSENKFDYIIHLASNADPKTYAVQPAETILTNILGCKNILDYCKEHQKTRMIFSSSFEVYGKLDGIDEFSEEMSGIIDQTVLRNGYPESKRCCELLVRSYFDEYGVDAVIVRLPSVYGPVMLPTDSKAHAQFIRNAVNGENIVLKSKGEQRRTYCYVVDAVSAVLLLLNAGKSGEIYNISNENSIASIAEVAECCAKAAGTRVVFELPDELEAKGFSKPSNCILINKKLRSLGWKGKFTIETGIRETIEYLEGLK